MAISVTDGFLIENFYRSNWFPRCRYSINIEKLELCAKRY